MLVQVHDLERSDCALMPVLDLPQNGFDVAGLRVECEASAYGSLAKLVGLACDDRASGGV